MAPIYINGRFAVQNLSGVQRFATEIAASLQKLHPDRVQILVPPGGTSHSLATLPVGKHTGHAWEQLDLPHVAKDGLLINLGNTAPLRLRRQIVAIHDAGVFSTPEAYSWKFRLWYKFMQRWLVSAGVTIVTVSEFSRREIIRHLHAKPEKIHVIPEGADHMNRTIADPAILHQHQLVPGKFALVVGNLAAHKNLKSLDVLAGQLADRGIPLVVTGALGGAAFRSNGQPQLPQPALYVGRVSDQALKCLYQSAACFIFPSSYEGFGLPAIEAMACGCPVIAADIAALRETCGKAAIFCNPNAPAEIAACAMGVIENTDLQSELRQAGLAQVAEMTWDRAALSLYDVISEVERHAA